MSTIFDLNSRVSKTDTGIQFYEQDILACSYLFEGDLIIDIKIDYVMPGFGIVIAEDNNLSFREAEDVYIFRVGYNDFSAIEKHLLNQNILVSNSCLLSPSVNNTNIHLTFTLKRKDVSLDWLYVNESGQEQTLNLGKVKLKRDLNKYKVGFYSNTQNIIRTASFLSGVPDNWHTSIKNVRGGRIAFFTDGFRIENCEYDAEIEQQDIKLKPGTYYVSYDTEKLNDKFDIDCIVFPTNTTYKESYFEDPNKNLLQNGAITITEDIPSINIKFKGTSGIITNIALKDDANSEFIETEGEVVFMDGSYMTVNLDKLSKLRWRGLIRTIPEYIDYTKPCPYAILETVSHRMTIEEAGIRLKQEYGFVYEVDSNTLTTRDTEYSKILKTNQVKLTDEDNNKINVFRNLNGYIYELILTLKDGTEFNVLAQKTFKIYVPADINSPIIVTSKDKLFSLDLSSSYREISKNIKKLVLYSTNQEITLKDDVPFNKQDYKIYTIPNDAVINLNGKTISEYASKYNELHSNYYKVMNRIVVLDDEVISKYKHIVLEYTSAEEFNYLFTNYEREIFTDTQSTIKLAKEPLEVANGLIIYGIKENVAVKEKYFYRVPSASLINSIDYYAETYDILDGKDYTIDYLNSEIRITGSVRNQYAAFIIDYLKNDSYAINYIEDYNQYEVDIATDRDAVYANYNMRDDGSILEYITTEIRPDKNKYILLRKDTD